MEGWHSGLNKCLPVHPNIFIYIHAIKICQASAEKDISKSEAGASPPRRKPKYIRLEEKISKAHSQHVAGKIDTYRLLRTVQYSVNLNKK